MNETNKKAKTMNRKEAVETRIQAIVKGLVGRVGFAAQEIGGSGEVIAVNGDETFVMASTYKVAIATKVLDRVDKGELTLDQMIGVNLDQIVGGDNIIAQQFVHPGLQLSVANLIEPMLTESDNTAADFCMRLAGGPEAVTQKLRDLGINDFRVDRLVVEILQDFYDLPGLAYDKVVNDALSDPEKFAHQGDCNLEFEKDPRDHTTPLAMLQLLLDIDGGKAISPSSREFILATMSRCRTGGDRLKGLLPKGTPVAHKTGTIGGVANDVGFITLPDGRRFAIAVYTKSSMTPEASRDRAIAEVARTLYDYFL
jgi:beta-lactamase class A